MKTKFLRLAFLIAALFGSSAVASAAEASKENTAMATKLFTALEKGDFEMFIADGDASWKALKKPQFDGMAANVAPKLKAGYGLIYLGEMKLRGNRVTLWKVDFKGNADDMLAVVTIKEGKVDGFALPRF